MVLASSKLKQIMEMVIWQFSIDGAFLSFDKINSGCQKNNWNKINCFYSKILGKRVYVGSV